MRRCLLLGLLVLGACGSDAAAPQTLPGTTTTTVVTTTTASTTSIAASTTTEPPVRSEVTACLAAADISLPSIAVEAPDQVQAAIDVCTMAQPDVNAAGPTANDVGYALIKVLLELQRVQLDVQSNAYDTAEQETFSGAIIDFQTVAAKFLASP